jgi:hypothetical protein
MFQSYAEQHANTVVSHVTQPIARRRDEVNVYSVFALHGDAYLIYLYFVILMPNIGDKCNDNGF